MNIGEGVSDLSVSDSVWAAGVKGALARVTDGVIDKQVSTGSPIRDIELVPTPTGKAIVAGCGDWRVRAFSTDAEPLWAYHCEPIPKERWFSYTVRTSKPEHSGVFAIAGGLGEQNRVAVVSTDSITLLDGAGSLVSRTDLTPMHKSPQGVLPNTAVARYPSDMAARAKRDGILIGAGFAAISSGRIFAATWIDGTRISIASAFTALGPGQTNMVGKYTRRVAHVRACDLDADGSTEILYALSGSWNELRVYASDGKPQWQKAFGPARTNSAFFRALDCADIDGDGKTEVLAGLQDGWVYAFNHDGALRWSRRLPWPVARVCGLHNQGLAIGTTAGHLLMLDAEGRTRLTAKLPGAVTTLAASPDRRLLIAGTSDGDVAALAVVP